MLTTYTPTPMSAADVAAHDKATYVRTPHPLSAQTRAALLAELRAAIERDDWDTVLGVELAAMKEDRRHPDQPRLMDEIRQIVRPVQAVAV